MSISNEVVHYYDLSGEALEMMDIYGFLLLFMDVFFWFWVFWGTVGLTVFLLYYALRLCVQVAEDKRAKRLMPLPAKSYFSSDSVMASTTCPICLDDFIQGDLLHWLPCSHVFHADCINEWFKGNHPSCPVCLTQVKDSPSTPLLATSTDNYHAIDID